MHTSLAESYPFTSRVRVVAAVALLFSLVGAAQPALANTITSASSRLGAYSQSDSDTGLSGQFIQSSSSQTGNGAGVATGQSSGNANAAAGFLRAYASASVSTLFNAPAGSSLSTVGQGRASWNDSLTIDAGSTLLGHSGFITATLDLSGSLGGNISGAEAWYGGEIGRNESVSMIGTGMSGDPGHNGGWNYVGSAYRDSKGGVYDNSYSNLSSPIVLNISVVFGAQTSLSYTLDALAGAFVLTRGTDGSSVDSFVDYTLSWGGITSVYDASGNALSNFTATSASGFDYYRPVNGDSVSDTSSTHALLGSALSGLFLLRRRFKT